VINDYNTNFHLSSVNSSHIMIFLSLHVVAMLGNIVIALKWIRWPLQILFVGLGVVLRLFGVNWGAHSKLHNKSMLCQKNKSSIGLPISHICLYVENFSTMQTGQTSHSACPRLVYLKCTQNIPLEINSLKVKNLGAHKLEYAQV